MTTPGAHSLVTFHFECLLGTYFSEYAKIASGSLLFSDHITDPYYNYFCPDASDSAKDIAGLQEEFAARGRRPAVYETPFSEPGQPGPEWEVWATDAWMTSEVSQISPPRNAVDDIVILKVGPSRSRDYVDVFQEAYSGDNPDDPYGQLDPGYARALAASFDHPLPGFNKHYILAERNDSPVAIAAMYTRGDIAGVYGVGTLPQHRKSGIGATLMYHLSKLAAAEGATVIMLQTEYGSKVEGWYRDLGYQTIFTAKYYVPPSRLVAV